MSEKPDDNIESIQQDSDPTSPSPLDCEVSTEAVIIKAIVDRSNEMIQCVNKGGKFIYVNDKWVELLGYTRAEACELLFTDILRRDQISHCMKVFQEICSGINVESVDTVFVSKDGTEIPIQGDIASIFEDGRFLMTSGMFRDMRTRNRKDELLERSELLYRSIFDNTGTAMIIIDEDSIISMVNSEFEKLSGLSRYELEGKKKWTEFVHEDDIERMIFYHEKRRIDNIDVPRQYEFRIRDKFGYVKNAFLTISLIPGTRKSIGSIIDITDRKRLESEYRDLVNQLHVVIYRSDLEGNILLINKTGLEFFQITEDDLKQFRAQDFYVDERDRNRLVKKINKHGHVKNHEVRLKRKDGRCRDCLITASIRQDERGDMIQGIIRDITHIRRSHNALLEKEALYKSLLSVSPEAMLILDLNDNIIDTSQRAVDLFGMDEKEDLVGKNVMTLFKTELNEMICQHLTNLKEYGDIREIELEMRSGVDGSFLAELKGSNIYGMGGELKAYILNVRDITERNRTNEQMIKRLSYEKALSELSSLFIGKHDLEQSINEALRIIGNATKSSRVYIFSIDDNEPKMDNIYEWCAEGILPQKDNLQDLSTDLFPWWMEKLRKGEIIDIQQVDEMPEAASAEKEILRSQDIRSLVVVPMILSDRLRGFIGYDNVNDSRYYSSEEVSLLKLVSDIIHRAIERVLIERDLREWKNNVEFYLDILSHDIGNIHQGISSWIYLSQLSKNEPERLKITLNNASELIQRSIKLIRNVLLLSHIKTVKSNPIELDLLPILQSAITKVESMMPDRELNITISGETGTIQVFAEPLLEEVFFNIIHNGIKFQRNDRSAMEIVITPALSTPGRVTIEITDHGTGIDDAMKESLFKRQINSHSKSHTGLGLCLVKELIDRYQGSVSIRDRIANDPSQGVTFVIELPMCL